MNEIESSKKLKAVKGGFDVNMSHSATFDMTGTDMTKKTQLIGLTWEALDFGEIGTVAEAQIVNLDAVNYVQLATANDGTGIYRRLKAGRSDQGPPEPGAVIYARANTAACLVAVAAVEE